MSSTVHVLIGGFYRAENIVSFSIIVCFISLFFQYQLLYCRAGYRKLFQYGASYFSENIFILVSSFSFAHKHLIQIFTFYTKQIYFY